MEPRGSGAGARGRRAGIAKITSSHTHGLARPTAEPSPPPLHTHTHTHTHTRTHALHTHTHTPHAQRTWQACSPSLRKKVKRGFGPWGPSPGPWPQRGGGSPSPGVRTEDPKARVPAPLAPGLIPGKGSEEGVGGRQSQAPGPGGLSPPPHAGKEELQLGD